MNKNTVILFVVSLASLLAGVSLFNLYSDPQIAVNEPQSMSENKPAKVSLTAIPLTDLDGNQKLLGNWQQPVLVVNFWAPWCAPCREEIPALIALQNKFEGQVQVIGLALDSEENVRSFELEYGMNYPSFLAGNKIPMYNAAFTNKSGSLPFTVIINQQREIHYSHTGKITLDQLQAELVSLLKTDG
ncbi:MAG: thiol-disulfide isomerase/thioredoxin [Candidatus Azotimanducaceae bacterium]|jgi:thiol-disulfide isomerase/thioredoxin